MKTRLLTLCAALPLLAALPHAAGAQTPTTAAAATTAPVTLRYKWTPGDVKRYKMTMDMNMAMSGAGVPALPAIAQHLVMAYDTTVQSVNPVDGSATLTEHITQMTATMNGRTLPGMDAMTDAYKGGFTVVMSPAGKMLSMKLPAAITGKMPAGMDMSKMGSMTAATLPLFPARVGDTWQDTTAMHMFDQMPGMPALQMTIFSSLAGVSADAHPVANIHQTYQGTLDSAVPAATAAKVNMAGQFHGDNMVKFDIDNGSVAAQDGTMTMNTTVAIPKMAATTKPMQMHMKMLMATHLEQLPAGSK